MDPNIQPGLALLDPNSEPRHPPLELVVHEAWSFPFRIIPNYDAYLRKTVVEAFEYLLAYHECTVPSQSFNNIAELDNEIIRQVAASNLNVTIVPDMGAKVHRIAAHVRNTWISKYGLTFGPPPLPLARFASGNVHPTPLFNEGQEVKLAHFDIYASFDDIYTPEKRKMVENVLTTLANESVARCMEALFRSDNDVGKAVAWLRENAV